MDWTQKVLAPFDEERDYMEERINHGIELNRKGSGTIKIVDSQGNPVPGARLICRQKTHDFKVGANLFMLDEFHEFWKNDAYRKVFAEAFNIATIPFYWSDLEPVQGKPRYSISSPKVYRRPAPDLCVDYCLKNGITPKGHCLVYEPFRAAWLDTEDITHVRRLYDKRIAEIGERYKDTIPMWEVTNETMYTHHRYGYTGFFSADDHVEWSFNCARRHLPLNQLIINDANEKIFKDFCYNRGQYYLQIEKLLNEGIPLGGIGMQFHMWGAQEDYPERAKTYFDPKLLYQVMDYYGRFRLPIQITEITLPCYGPSTEMEDLQAEIIRNLYSIWFSHEAMEAIIYWNLVDGTAFAGENELMAGLLRSDMTPKPAFNAIRELFGKTWHTELKTGTNDDGITHVRGFYGNYDVEVHANDISRIFSIGWHANGTRSITLTI